MEEYQINMPEYVPEPYKQFAPMNGDIVTGELDISTGQTMVLIWDINQAVEYDGVIYYDPVLFPLGYLKKWENIMKRRQRK